ncbi:Inhibitor of growth protein 3 [Geranomyces variabilis]|nr:Inhibitor of growth protein 3 [Geranomyces variabilis]
MPETSHRRLQAALLLALARCKPLELAVDEYATLLLQPGALEVSMNSVAHTTRSFVADVLSDTVCVALDAGQDARVVYAGLNDVEKINDRAKAEEFKAQIEELQIAQQETRRKLCQAELEVKSLHQKHREHTGTKKKKAHTYQKTKAAALAKEESAIFGGGVELRSSMEFLELVRLLLRASEQGGDLQGTTRVGNSFLVANAAQQILRHSMDDVRRRCLELGKVVQPGSRDRQHPQDAQQIREGLRQAAVGLRRISFRILEFASSECFSSQDHEQFAIIYTAFARDVVDLICMLGAANNDFCVTVENWHETEAATLSDSSGKPRSELDACQTLCHLLVDIGAIQRILVPSMMLMLAEKCDSLTRLSGMTDVKILPDKFPELDQRQQGLSAPEFWKSSLAGVDNEYAAISALSISYYLFYTLEQLLHQEHGPLQEGYVNERLVCACLSLLVRSLTDKLGEHSAFAFRVCVRMQNVLGSGRFCVHREAMKVVKRHHAASQQTAWDLNCLSCTRDHRDDDHFVDWTRTLEVDSVPPPLLSSGVDNEQSGSHVIPSFCYCHKDTEGTLILCERDGCDVGWYHLACVGLSDPPKGEWICSQCCFEPI